MLWMVSVYATPSVPPSGGSLEIGNSTSSFHSSNG